MAEPILISNMKGFMGLLPDLAVNGGRLLTAEQVGILFNSSQPPFPDVLRSADQQIGGGSQRARKLRRGWWIPQQITVGGLLSTETAARFGARNLGGTRVAAAEVLPGAGAYDIVTYQRNRDQSLIPKLTTLGYDMGGYKFVHPSLATDTFEMAFDGENDVTWQATLRGTGFHRINQLPATLIANGHLAGYANAVGMATLLVPPAVPAHHLMHPASVRVTFSNGQSFDFAVDGELISGACSNNNQIIVQQQPGDGFMDPANRKSGAVAREIFYGVQVPMARIKVKLEPTLRAFVLAQNGADITSLEFLFKSEDDIAASGYAYEIAWKAALSELESAQADPDGDRAAVAMQFYIKDDPVNQGFWQQRVRTADQAIQ